MDFEKGTYFATFGLLGTASWSTDNYSGSCFQAHSEGFYDVTGLAYDPNCTNWDTSLQALITGGLPANGALGGSASFVCASQALSSLVGNPMGADTNLFSWTITWSMTPTPANLGVVVTIPTYNSWRPTGGRTEKEIGTSFPSNSPNVLAIQAQLVDMDTGMPSYLIPDKVTFTLADVSREPGVAMNWPEQAAATTDPDMTFDCALNLSPGETTIKVDSTDCFKDFETTGTQLEFDPDYNFTPVVATLSPHDWGGWATLNVSAMVAGVAYQGSLASNPHNANILLPERQPNSFIADTWKNANGIPLNTHDDSDGEIDLTSVGDGLTLYEEYRGFYMGCFDNPSAYPQPEATRGALCQHVEGDPKRKDLFIANLASADAGIMQFQVDTNIKVHFRGLSLSELGGNEHDGAYERVINFNHSQGAHEVDQHALVIDMGTLQGTSAAINTPSVVSSCPSPFMIEQLLDCRPGLPKEIQSVTMGRFFEVQDLDATNTSWVQTVTHELGHAADVYHHGDIDHLEFWTTVDGGGYAVQTLDANENAAGAPIPIHVLAEDVDPNSPFVELPLTLSPPSEKNPKDSQGHAIPGFFVYVGNAVCGNTVVMNGQHSGDVYSAMRYTNAHAYIPSGFPNIRYWVNEENLGYELTDHPGGTGVNAPGTLPRVRYGDAYSGRGNDASDIDINDSHTAVLKPAQVCRP